MTSTTLSDSHPQVLAFFLPRLRRFIRSLPTRLIGDTLAFLQLLGQLNAFCAVGIYPGLVSSKLTRLSPRGSVHGSLSAVSVGTL